MSQNRHQPIEEVDFSVYPKAGTYSRKELTAFCRNNQYQQWNILESVEFRGHAVLFERNFKVRGPYADDQIVDLFNPFFTMWSLNQLNTVRVSMNDEELQDLESKTIYLELAVEQLSKMCNHDHRHEFTSEDYKVHKKTPRMFDHWIKCDDCGDIWCHDSSG